VPEPILRTLVAVPPVTLTLCRVRLLVPAVNVPLVSVRAVFALLPVKSPDIVYVPPGALIVRLVMFETPFAAIV
jgi:hypothetical protein